MLVFGQFSTEDQKSPLFLRRAYGFDNLSRVALGAHVAERFFSIQHAIKHLTNRQQLGWICFLTRLLSEVSPITSLWDHGKPPFCVWDFPNVHSVPKRVRAILHTGFAEWKSTWPLLGWGYSEFRYPSDNLSFRSTSQSWITLLTPPSAQSARAFSSSAISALSFSISTGESTVTCPATECTRLFTSPRIGAGYRQLICSAEAWPRRFSPTLRVDSLAGLYCSISLPEEA
jgi:hypothetical protein